IETTGIADPAGVIDNFMAYEEIYRKFVVDSVICLADAQTYEESAEEQPEVHRQLAVADIIILNKIEDVTPEYGEHIKKLIRSVNPTATLYCTSHAKIDNIDILDTFAYSAENVEKLVVDFKNATPLKFDMMNFNDNAPSFAANPQNKHNDAFHHSIVSEGFTIEGDLDEKLFVDWLQGVLQYNSASVFRVKGIISFVGRQKKYILQSVRQYFFLEEGDFWEDDEKRYTKLVFIGKKLSREAIEEYLESFVI
ncbi:MAG: GTP-binding protein, partial [Bacteroidales bacterium]|nr:GTP-binding protein [Bacteroidales bacterium]